MSKPLHRTIKLKPTTVLIRTRIESPRKHELTQTTIEALNKNVTGLIKFVQDKTADYLTPEFLKRLKTVTDKAKEDGRKLPSNALMRGLVQPDLPDNKTIFTPSRVTDLIQENVARMAKTWNGEDDHIPSSPAEIHLSGSNNQYSQITKITKDDFIVLVMKTLTVEYLIYFHAPKKYLKRYGKINKPDITLRDDGSLEWRFSLEVVSPSPNLSFKYVIGVDRGVVEAAVWSVVSLTDGHVVDSLTSSTEHHQARAKIRRQFQNKKGIKAAIKRDNPGVEDLTTVPRWARVTELNHAITNAKIDASRLLAQEIVATAVAYDNCLIMMEDLSWSGNWWGEPYGVLLHWTDHYAELAGLHVMKVNPAWSSTSCSVCGAVFKLKKDEANKRLFHGTRVFSCPSCKAELDRDVNASVNIARRGLARARKSARTRLWGNRSKREAGVVTPRQSRVLRSRVLRPVSLVRGTGAGDSSSFSSLSLPAGNDGLPGASVQCGVTHIRVDGRVAYDLRL